MGAYGENGWLKSNDKAEAEKEFKELQERLRYEYGTDSYNGTFSNNSGIVFEERTFDTADEAEDYLLGKYEDKWGPVGAVRIKGKKGWFIAGWVST